MNIEELACKLSEISDALESASHYFAAGMKKETIETLEEAKAEADGHLEISGMIGDMIEKIKDARTQEDAFNDMIDDVESGIELYDCGEVTAIFDGTDLWACLTEDYDAAIAVLSNTLAGDAVQSAYQALCEETGCSIGTASGIRWDDAGVRTLAEAICAASGRAGNDRLKPLAKIAQTWLDAHIEDA